MKTKFQILAAFVALVAFSNVGFAYDITGIPASANQNTFNLVTPATGSGNMLTNAIVLSDGTVISNDANTTSYAKISDKDESTLSYHHGSGGSDDGISGKNIVYLGVGFVSISGLLTSAYTTEGYTSSHIPPITLAYERGLSAKFGFGVQFEYTSFNLSLNNVAGDPYFNGGNAYTYSDKLSLTGIGFGLIGTYSFVTSGKVEPYFGYGIGYETFSFKWSTTDPNAAIDGNVDPGKISGGLPWFNIFLGSRFFFTDHVGAYIDFGWHGLVGGIINVGLAAKF